MQSEPKQIPLTKGYVAIVDADDYEELSKHKWYPMKSPKAIYAGRAVRKNGRPSTILMHRQVNHTPEGMLTDHINGNGLDNRKINLRSCSLQENNRARRKSKKKHYSSQYKGVHWDSSTKAAKYRKWKATFSLPGMKNRHRIGAFRSEIEAAAAYDIYAIKYHGDFAVTNFPKESYDQNRSRSVVESLSSKGQ